MRSALACAVKSCGSIAPASWMVIFDLLQVGAAIRARTQMRLETAPVTTPQGTFEVVGDQLDGLLAYQGSGQEPHGQPS